MPTNPLISFCHFLLSEIWQNYHKASMHFFIVFYFIKHSCLRPNLLFVLNLKFAFSQGVFLYKVKVVYKGSIAWRPQSIIFVFPFMNLQKFGKKDQKESSHFRSHFDFSKSHDCWRLLFYFLFDIFNYQTDELWW